MEWEERNGGIQRAKPIDGTKQVGGKRAKFKMIGHRAPGRIQKHCGSERA